MHTAAYTPSQVGYIENHDERFNEYYKDNHVDASLSYLNYSIYPCDENGEMIKHTIGEFVNERKAKVKEISGTEIKGNQKVMSSTIVTLPETLYDADENLQKAFFQTTFDVLCDEVGKDNVAKAVIHYDEPNAKPHMHFIYVPAVVKTRKIKDETKPIWKKDPKTKQYELDENGNRIQKTNKRGTKLFEQKDLLDENGNPVRYATISQSAMFPLKRMNRFHDDVNKAVTDKMNSLGIIDTRTNKVFNINSIGIKKDYDDEMDAEFAKILNKVPIKERKSFEKYFNQLKQSRNTINRMQQKISDKAKELSQAIEETKQLKIDLKKAIDFFVESCEIAEDTNSVLGETYREQQEVKDAMDNVRKAKENATRLEVSTIDVQEMLRESDKQREIGI